MANRAKASKAKPRGPFGKRRRVGRDQAPPSMPDPHQQSPDKPADAAVDQAKVTIRFFCQGIGDCHLLKFPKDNGGDFWMLIDCGIHSSIAGGTEKIKEIVANIRSLTSRLDVVVLTHEHWDHNSGFFAAREEFQDVDIGEVWMAWTENPQDPQARQLDKFKGNALNALKQASELLDNINGLGPHLSAVKDGVEAVLGFNFGAKGEKVRSAREAAIELAKGRAKYFEPKTAPIRVPELANSVRIYVLGPPRDVALLGLTERASEMYGVGALAGWPLARVLGNALGIAERTAPDLTAPFDLVEGHNLSRLRSNDASGPTNGQFDKARKFLHDYYDGPAILPSKVGSQTKTSDPNEQDQSWRRIDHDWLAVSADLALQIDDRTNNSSLVLAFEFLDSKRVMLFVGDAQIGNWLSWDKLSWASDPTTVTDLLRRTIFYKVGHHGSHNATPKQHGLELMASPDLSAFIPTNEQDAKKVKWGEMPFKPILGELERRTSGRLIRADDPWLTARNGRPAYSEPSGAILATRHDPSGEGLWVELDIA